MSITDRPIDPAQVLAAVADPTCGAVDLFVGTVRDHDGGRGVDGLAYEAHPMASDVLDALLAEVVELDGVVLATAVHRVGPLAVGDVAVVTAVSAPHRAHAFAANRVLIDRLKAEVPIWKKQTFTDGSAEWVGA